MSLYQQSVVQMSKMLRNLDACLTKAVAFAEAKDSAADDFVGARLTFDMRPLAFQIQSACDTAKFTAARLSGGEAPSHEDKETTMAELSARIQATLDYLDGVEEGAFEGAAKREVTLSFLPGQGKAPSTPNARLAARGSCRRSTRRASEPAGYWSGVGVR